MNEWAPSAIIVPAQNSSALPKKGWANGFLPKCLFCSALAAAFQDIRIMLPSDMSLNNSWNQFVCPLYSLLVQWYMLQVFPTNYFCTVGLLPLAPHLTSCGGFGLTTLICQCDPHPQHFLPRGHCHTDWNVWTANSWHYSSHAHWSHCSLINAGARHKSRPVD